VHTARIAERAADLVRLPRGNAVVTGQVLQTDYCM
jgi:hypothetical protein